MSTIPPPDRAARLLGAVIVAPLLPALAVTGFAAALTIDVIDAGAGLVLWVFRRR